MNFIQFINLTSADLRRLENFSSNGARVRFWVVVSPKFLPVLIVRLAQYFYSKNFFRFLSFILMRINLFVFGIEFTPRCKVGPGLMLPHTVGTVVGAFELGENVTIFQGVTIGASHLDFKFDKKLRPKIGSNVTIGAGAKILGGVAIRNWTVIGANAVVLDSTPSNSLVAGVPARVVKLYDSNA